MSAITTLLAMLSQRFDAPYDVWLCDEAPSEEVLTWCRGRGVRVSTRRGQPEYHRAQWPGRTKCKEGNLAFFYDRFGYRDYDVVAQLDCDPNKAGSPLIP
jgi:cellulose synthase (UDP-forming)